MENIKLDELILSILCNTAHPASGKEILELSEHELSAIQGMVFLPSGDGYLVQDNEQEEKKE